VARGAGRRGPAILGPATIPSDARYWVPAAALKLPFVPPKIRRSAKITGSAVLTLTATMAANQLRLWFSSFALQSRPRQDQDRVHASASVLLVAGS
jgi:hypothetical protein